MKFNKLISSFVLLMLVINQFFLSPIFAEEYTVSGNGENSSNQINVEQKTEEKVSQENKAKVKNEVKTESNTGENSASDNIGNSEIKTGDAKTEVVVSNSGNQNIVSEGCCPSESDSKAKITDNGSGSSNSINHNSNSNTSTSQNNGAKITNNIKVYADTGNNNASGNGGDVYIETGEVKTGIGVLNKGNTSYMSSGKKLPSYDSKISGNGSDSNNVILNEYENNENFLVNNYLILDNNLEVYGNTGGNTAKNNNGKVFISTGNVLLDIILKNKVNESIVIADCECKNVPSPSPSPSVSPSPSGPPSGGENNGGSNNGGSSSSGDSGSSSGSSNSNSGGQVLGLSLPATGGFSILSLTVLAFGLLIAGIILRVNFENLYEEAKNYFQYFNFNVAAPAVIYILAFCKNLSLSRQADFARRLSFYNYPQDFGLRPAY
jgi:hypothetical protein